MRKSNSTILTKFIWQLALVMGIGISAYSQTACAASSVYDQTTFQSENKELGSLHFLVNEKSHTPFPNLPAEESSSNEENSEEENEETKDSELDGELSHYQVDSSLNPYTDPQAFINNSKNHESYNIPLYILFHCWRSFIS